MSRPLTPAQRETLRYVAGLEHVYSADGSGDARFWWAVHHGVTYNGLRANSMRMFRDRGLISGEPGKDVQCWTLTLAGREAAGLK